MVDFFELFPELESAEIEVEEHHSGFRPKTTYRAPNIPEYAGRCTDPLCDTRRGFNVYYVIKTLVQSHGTEESGWTTCEGNGAAKITQRRGGFSPCPSEFSYRIKLVYRDKA